MPTTGITLTVNAETRDALSSLTNFFKSVEEGMNNLSGSIAAIPLIGEVAAGLLTLEKAWEGIKSAVEGYVEGVSRAIDRADELKKLSEKTGLPVELLSALEREARKLNLPFEELSQSLSLFSEKVFEAVRVGGDATRVFADLGIPLYNTAGVMRPFEEILNDVLRQLREMPDGVLKSGAAWELFGRGFARIIPLANRVGGQLDELKGKAVIDSQMAEQAEQFKATMAELHGVLDDIWATVAKNLLPTLNEFAQWLKTVISDEQLQHEVIVVLVAAFRLFALAVMQAYLALGTIYDLVKGTDSLGIGVLLDAVRTAIQVFDIWTDTIAANVHALADLGTVNTRVSQALAAAASGDFVRAWQLAQKGVKDVSGDLDTLRHSSKDALHETGDSISTFFRDAFHRAQSQGDETIKSLTARFATFHDFLDKTFAPVKGMKSAQDAAEKKPQSAAPTTAPLSDAARDAIKEIDKAWTEATQGKLAALRKMEADEIAEIDIGGKKQIADFTLREQEMTRIRETYAAKRRQIEDEQADRQIKRQLDDVKGKIDLVNKDPDLTEAERKRQLLPLLEQERQLLQSILFLKTGELDQSDRSDDDKQKLRDQIAELKKQLADLQAERSKTAQSPFQGMMMQLQNMNNLQKNVADAFAKNFNTAISSISSNLTSVIMKTETWRQALLKIGQTILTSIISSIIEIGVRWIATQLLMAIAGKVIASAQTAALAPIAAAQSAIWAGPATLSTIASYGEAADQAPGMILAAQAVVDGMSGFASGGLVTGPGDGTSDSVLARLSRGEYVIPAHAVDNIGLPVLESIRSGQGLHEAVVHSLTKPYYQTAEFQQQQAEAATNGGGAGAPIVQGHKMNVTLVNPANRQEMLDALASNEGHKIVINHVKKGKMQIGLGS